MRTKLAIVLLNEIEWQPVGI